MNKKWLIAALVAVVAVISVLLITRPWEVRVAHQDEIYTCPMHPSVISDRPGACPVCGMALVKKQRTAELRRDTSAVPNEVALSPAQRVAANIATVTVGRRRMVPSVSALGVATYVEPRRAIVAARFRGRIEKLFVGATGARVERGAPLFALYSPDLITAQQEYLVATNAGENGDNLAAAARARLIALFGMTAEQVDSLHERRSVRTSMVFHSPLAGTVVQKDVQEGQYVDEGMELYELADLRRIWCVFDIYERDLRFVRTGMPVAISADAFPGESFNGTVTLIEPTLNQETRTVRVRSELENPGLRLRPNMFVKGRILGRALDVLAVPSSALMSTGNRSVVWVETSPNHFAPRDVLPGVTAEGYTEILHGVRAGEVVASTGGFLIDSESQLSQTAVGLPEQGGHKHD